ncbi:MAG: hypothetical protein A3C11_02880 [Candidatus Sungbacteria bacterium RIFCSPHIGHO2_02_FULL_49_12]|uniref:TspO protein n=1 Tax=Candidatus Sungbacteria bacterium RIFCSPHIGHO2_02_FULL_49_12 TaxID=1802271 RepID=A0A1G2KMA8_9BACT|nr:MAG: hypothetical protein A3C11_02880 [Candidatus Sungbacteria bacterium RIFCSPHIGHO2_02_FULL_49_12]
MRQKQAYYDQYDMLKKPSWAPRAKIFGSVWAVLYVLMAASYGYVFYMWWEGVIPFAVLVPFLLNLIFNFAFTTIQFGLRNLPLAAVDILLVLATLAWALVAIYPYNLLVVYANLPYLVWLCFATVLEIHINVINR